MKEMLIRVINVPEEDFTDTVARINEMAKDDCKMELNQTDLSMEIDYSLCKEDLEMGNMFVDFGGNALALYLATKKIEEIKNSKQ